MATNKSSHLRSGKFEERRVEHREEADKFCRDLGAQGAIVRVGMEASGLLMPKLRQFIAPLEVCHRHLRPSRTCDVPEFLREALQVGSVGLARKKNVEMPIAEQMFAILENGQSPQQAIEGLMTRAARSEIY